MIVEDNEKVKELTRRLLSSYGYNILMASSVKEAIELLEREPKNIDLLFTDVIMPGINGVELADFFRQKYPNGKVIFTSGYMENTLAKNGVLKEGINFISKPYSAGSLCRKIKSILREKN